MPARVGSLWVGGRLSFFELVTLRSHLDAGHDVTLFTDTPPANLPAGIRVRAPSELAPPPPFDISNLRRKRVAVWSDIFRLHMLRRTDLTWIDTDAYCLAPFPAAPDWLFAPVRDARIGSGVLRLPPGSATLAGMLDFVATANPIPPWYDAGRRAEMRAELDAGKRWGLNNLSWASSGPKALTHFLSVSGEIRHALAPDTFYPLNGETSALLLAPDADPARIERPGTLSVHLFGHIKNAVKKQHGGLPPAGSYLARICRRHGIDPTAHPV